MSSPGRRVPPAVRAIGRLLLLAFAISVPFVTSGSLLSTATLVVIAAIGVLGIDVLVGYAGQISLGHAFFLAVGAYTAAALGGDHHLSALAWIPLAGVAAALGGAIVGPAALRIRGLYLAIVTIGLVYIGQHILNNLPSLSGGPEGRAFPPIVLGSLSFAEGHQLTIAGVLTVKRDGLYYFLALAVFAAATVFVRNVKRTRPGRAMQAVRDREAAAPLLGIGVARTKLAAFVLSSFLAGVCGAIYASYLSYAQPGEWGLLLSIQFVAAIIVGGMGTAGGPLLGSLVVFALPSLIKLLPFVSRGEGTGIPPGDLSDIIYGLLIILILVMEPDGVVGLLGRMSPWRVDSARRPSRAAATGISTDEEQPTGRNSREPDFA